MGMEQRRTGSLSRDSYVDVVSMDVYLPEYLPTDYAETYKKLVTATSRNKITALAEIGYLPDIDLLQKVESPGLTT